MRKYKVTMIMIFVCLAFSGMAQKGIKLNLKAGDKWCHELRSTGNRQDTNPEGEKGEINDENILSTIYEVLGAGSGTYDVKATFNAIKFKASSPDNEGEITFDSQNPEDLNGDDGKAVKKVIGKSYVFTIDANTHKVIAIKERPLKEEGAATPQSPLEPAIHMFPQDDEQFKKKVEGLFGGMIPDEKLASGVKWDRADTEKKQGITNTTSVSYIIDRVDGGKVYVNVSNKTVTDGILEGNEEMGEVKVTGSSNGSGSFLVDAASGLKVESKSSVKGERIVKTSKGESKTNIAISYIETVKKVTAM